MIVAAAEDKGHCDGAASGISASERSERIGHDAKAIVFEGDVDVRLLYGVERQLFDIGYFPVVIHAPGLEAQHEALNQSHICLSAGLIPLIHFDALDPKDITRVLGSEKVVSLRVTKGEPTSDEEISIADLDTREASKRCREFIAAAVPRHPKP